MKSPLASFFLGLTTFALTLAILQVAQITITFADAILAATIYFVLTVAVEAHNRRSTH